MNPQPTWDQFFDSFSASRRIADATLQGYRKNLGYFLKFCQATDDEIAGPCDVQSRHLNEFYRAQKNAPGISEATAGARMRSLLILLRWGVVHEVLLIDPSKGLKIPKPNRPIPPILTQQEVSLLLDAPNQARRGFIRVRDRALLELLYGTGMRRGEVVALNLEDLDLADRSLRIRGGKGKDRLVPFGESVARALSSYLDWLRPRYCLSGETALFLSLHGERMTRSNLTNQLHRYGTRLGLTGVTPHALRRALATHLLENGAHILEIKKLLGHEDLNSTMTYTQIFPVDLIRSHRKAHPRARRRGH